MKPKQHDEAKDGRHKGLPYSHTMDGDKVCFLLLLRYRLLWRLGGMIFRIEGGPYSVRSL